MTLGPRYETITSIKARQSMLCMRLGPQGPLQSAVLATLLLNQPANMASALKQRHANKRASCRANGWERIKTPRLQLRKHKNIQKRKRKKKLTPTATNKHKVKTRPMLKKKVKMALNGRPPFPSPEVSSAPSWFEFSSFLLAFAAEADMLAGRSNLEASGKQTASLTVREEAGFAV